MKKGFIIPNLPNEVYHKSEKFKEYISSTSLKNYMVSPKFFKYCQENPREIGLEASMRGSVYHSILASLTNTGCYDEFYDEFFVFEPPINPKTQEAYRINTKAYMECYNEACEENLHKYSTSQAEVDLALKMVDELLNNCGSTSESVRQVMDLGRAELSFFCEHEGAKFKFRTDLKTSNKIVDWKTIDSKDLHPDTIIKQIIKFQYGFSAAFYQFFDYQIHGTWSDFFWVFQQKSPPYDAVMVDARQWGYAVMDDGTVNKGDSALKFENVLSQHLYCMEKQRYHGAEIFIMPNHKGRRIMTVNVPNFELQKYPQYFNYDITTPPLINEFEP